MRDRYTDFSFHFCLSEDHITPTLYSRKNKSTCTGRCGRRYVLLPYVLCFHKNDNTVHHADRLFAFLSKPAQCFYLAYRKEWAVLPCQAVFLQSPGFVPCLRLSSSY